MMEDNSKNTPDSEESNLLPVAKPKWIPPMAGKGRAKGQINKYSKNVKMLMSDAFEGIGGLEALIAWGKDNPGEFYKLWIRILPLEIKSESTVGITIVATRIDENL